MPIELIDPVVHSTYSANNKLSYTEPVDKMLFF